MRTITEPKRGMGTLLATASAVLCAALVLAAPASHAGMRDPGVNQRQHHQQHRIQQGVRSGELTRAEVRSARSERRAIGAEERAYKADGTLTRAERRDLHQDLNEASRDLYRDKHDDQQRPAY